jgi:hypothetical protein
MDSLSTFDHARPEDLLTIARGMAAHILAQLAPVFPLIHAQTKNQIDADAWADAWARQIIANKLQPSEIKSGLSRVGELMRSRNVPFSLALFLDAARPQGNLSGHDYESRQQHHSLLIKEDLLQNESWVKTRNLAFEKLRKMGYLREPDPQPKEKS